MYFDRHRHQGLIGASIYKLATAVYKLLDVMGDCPNIRPKVFQIADGVSWPLEQHGQYWFGFMRIGGRARPLEDSVWRIMDCVPGDPRSVLRVQRRIQAAIAWCEARRLGIEKHKKQR